MGHKKSTVKSEIIRGYALNRPRLGLKCQSRDDLCGKF